MNAVTNLSSHGKAGTGAKRASLPFSYRSAGAVLMWFDLVAVPAISILSGVAYHLVSTGSYGYPRVFVGTGMLVGYLFVSILYARGAYNSANVVSARPRYGELVSVWFLVFLGLTALAFVFQIGDEFSRGSVLSFLTLGLAALLISRKSMSRLTRSALDQGLLRGERIIFIGQGGSPASSDQLRNLRRYGYRIAHNIMVPIRHGGEDAQSIVDEVVAVAKTEQIDEIVLALHWSKLHLIDQIVVGLRKLPLPVRLLPDAMMRHLMHLPTSDLGASISLELGRGPLSGGQRVQKRVLDLLCASLGLLAISPLLAMVALLIKLDSRGPVFFRQIRTGYSGRTFRIYKFRTMKVLEDGEIVAQARKDDSRVTRLGRWLRRTSIDELPQLINVLLGDMSLVGPRPHALAHDLEYDRLIGSYGLRFQVKPGITGWAQVNGYRGETATVDLMMSRVECDLWYINNWSLALDVRTLLKTVGAQFGATNAY